MIGVVLDGCPAGIPVQVADFTADLHRRKSGATGTTSRDEDDIPQLVSGLNKGYTTGAPVAILFANNNIRPDDYAPFRDIPRPGHADFTATQKWHGFNDLRGGGHFSGRLTLALVAAGVMAKKMIAPVTVSAELLAAGGSQDVDGTIAAAIAAGDSVGGLVGCCAKNIPAGWGSPFFDSVESLLSHLVFAIPGVKGIDFGAGFDAAAMHGSQHNDPIISTTGATATNNAGGINGGLTNSNDLVFRVAVKPASSIARRQYTLNMATGQMTDLSIDGRPDACIALRMPVIVEAATAIVLADLQQERKLNFNTP
jgi:chorismate synthase